MAGGVVAVALASGVTVYRLSQDGSSSTRRPGAITSLSGSPSSPPVAPPGGGNVEPRLAGVIAALPGGVRLVVGGEHPMGLGAGVPSLRRVPVPAGWEVARVTVMPAGLLVAVQRLQLLDTAPSSKFYLVRPDRRVLLLAAGDEAAASFDGTAVFTVRSGAAGPGSRPNPGVLSEVSLSGRVLHRHPVPAAFDLQADTAAGLLVAVYRQPDGPSDLRIVDRTTLAVRQRLGEVSYLLTATPTRAVWVTAGCTTACRLVVADLPTGARRSIPLPRDYQPGAVGFSPDGRRLAISYFGRHPQQPGGGSPGVVDVVDLTTGGRQRLPGVGTGIKQAADLSWTPDGQWLAVAVGWPDSGFRRIGLWPATGGPVRVLPGRYAGGYLSGALLAV